MFLAKVTGAMVSTQKVASMVGHKLLLVDPCRLDRRPAAAWSSPTLAGRVDTVGAGEGEIVLIRRAPARG